MSKDSACPPDYVGEQAESLDVIWVIADKETTVVYYLPMRTLLFCAV